MIETSKAFSLSSAHCCIRHSGISYDGNDTLILSKVMDQSKEVVKMLESRVYQINELENYANCIENEIKMVANQFGLKDEDIMKYTNMRQCPYDNGHSVPIMSYEKHIKNCALRKMGYSEEDFKKAPPSSKFYYENNPDITTVVIDQNLQSHILYQAAQEQPFSNGIEGPRGIRGHHQALQNLPVPLTSDRSITELTEAERLAIYDHVIRCTKCDTKASELTLEDLQFSFELQNKDKEGKPKSKLEILAELRDYKRRRQSYRAKNVHITKKSYTEVMKEVISNMTVFLESINETTEPKTEEIDCPSTSRVEDSELPLTHTLVKPESYSNSLDESYKMGYSRGKSNSLMGERSGCGKRQRDSNERSPSPTPRKNRKRRSSTHRKNRKSRSSTPRKTLKKRSDSSERSISPPRNTYERRRDDSERSRSSSPLKSRKKREDSSDESRRSIRHKRSRKKSHHKKSNRHKHKRVKREKFSPEDSNKSS